MNDHPKLQHPGVGEITLDGVLGALSDGHRRRIVELLVREGDSLSGTCTAWAGVAPSAGSHHLRVLREAGVTRTRIEGNQRVVALRRSDLDQRFPGLLDTVLAASTTDPSTLDQDELLG